MDKQAANGAIMDAVSEDLAKFAGRKRAPELFADLNKLFSRELTRLWQTGRFVGAQPNQAFFVRCDGQTSSEKDIGVDVGFALHTPSTFSVTRFSLPLVDGTPADPGKRLAAKLL